MSITRRAFARELGCPVGAIAAAIDRGMPVSVDDKIDRSAALMWLRKHGSPRLRAAALAADTLFGHRTAAS